MVLIKQGDAEDFESAIAVWRVAYVARGRPVPESEAERVRSYSTIPDAFKLSEREKPDDFDDLIVHYERSL